MNPTQRQFSLKRAASKKQFPISNQASNGNGRPKTADGSYPSNTSPVHLFEIPAA